MKNSNYNTPPPFESLVIRERLRSVPQVNVRSAVREALQADAMNPSWDALFDEMTAWFSGIRGWLATALALASVLAMAALSYQEIDSLIDGSEASESDPVSTFIENGDWSELL